MATATAKAPKPPATEAGASIRIPRLSDHEGFVLASAKYDQINSEYTAATSKLSALQAEIEAFPAATDTVEMEAQALAGYGSPDEIAQSEKRLASRKELEVEIAQLEPRVKVLTRALQIASGAIDQVRHYAMASAVRAFGDAVLAPIAEEAVAAFVKAGELMQKLRDATEVGENAGLRTGFSHIEWDDWNPRKNAALYLMLMELVHRGLIEDSAFLE